jgi:integrase
MPRKPVVPKYRRHANGQVFVQIKGRRLYLGKFGSQESHDRYAKFIADLPKAAERIAAQRSSRFPARFSINELIVAYMRHAQEYYRKPAQDGKSEETSEVTNLKYALRPLAEKFGATDAIDFDTVRLKGLRQTLIEADLCRSVVNKRISLIRRVFRWAAEEKMLPSSVWHDLKTLRDLRAGRTLAREAPRVPPVAESVVNATLPYLPPIVADMVMLQRHTGCRPGEVCGLRPCDVDRRTDVWAYTPASHKTQHHGRERIVFIGPRAQAILSQYLKRPAEACCFSPAESERVRLAELHLARVTPIEQGNRPGTNQKGRRKPLADRYTKDTYNRAIRHAVDRLNGQRLSEWLNQRGAINKKLIRRILRAIRGRPEGYRDTLLRRLKIEVLTIGFVPRWSPNQLHHSAATEIRRRFGLEMSRVVLGHSEIQTTQIYAERDLAAAAAVMREVG